jgi:hypothetical protein
MCFGHSTLLHICIRQQQQLVPLKLLFRLIDGEIGTFATYNSYFKNPTLAFNSFVKREATK